MVPLHGLTGGERANPIDRRPRAERASLLEEAAHLEEQRNQCGGYEIAGRGRGEDRDCDQLIGSAARISGDDAAEPGRERRNGHNRCRQRPAHLADLPLVW